MTEKNPVSKQITPGLNIYRNRLGKMVRTKEGPVTVKIAGGPLLVIEEMPWLHSASLGFFFPRGSGSEPPEVSGITHFIEHLIFKGTKTRTPRDIALAYEGVGGMLNASTGKETMNVYGRIGSRYIERGFRVIADMFLNPRFLDSDVEKEKGVILEEIRMVNDVHDQYLFEEFSKQVWGKNPLAKPIAGTEKSLKGIEKKNVLKWYSDHFHPANMLISVSGEVDASKIPQWWAEVSGSKKKPEVHDGKSKDHEVKAITPKWKSGVKVYRRDVEQAIIIFGFPAPNVREKDRYPYTILDAVLGGGMGARLFQQIREKLGLAYDIETGFSPMRGTGVYTIDSATAPAMLFKLVEQTFSEIRKLKTKPVGKSEMNRVKDFLEGSTFLGMESSSNRMFRNAYSQMYLGELIPTEVVMERLQAVTDDDVISTARKYLNFSNFACGVLAPKDWETDTTIQDKINSIAQSILS